MAEAGALVAGGGSGLGAATSRRLAAAGYGVVVFDLNLEAAERLASEIGEGASAVSGDVADEEAVRRAVSAARDFPQGLRVAVNCAGIGISQRTVGRSGPHDLESFERVLRVNLVGTFNVLRLAAATMSDNEPLEDGERGVIVSTASVAAFEPQIGQVAYGASKGGIVSMTLAAARDLAGRGIRVMTIAPGTFDTPLLGTLSEEVRQALAESIPFPKRLGNPEEYGALVEHIVSNRMLNGETIRLDGALRMAPR